MPVVLVLAVVFIILCLAELGWRRHWLRGELGRKFVHILVGTFVAFWPFFLTWNQIRLLSVAFLLVVIISKSLRVFQAIHSVERPTYGELFFALIVGLLTFITHSKAVYAAALLQMSLADGLAAIVGVHFGAKRGGAYKVFGHLKTPIGTATFFVVSAAILLTYSLVGGNFAWPWVLLLAAGAAALENVAIAGLDNLLVPLFIASMLLWL